MNKKTIVIALALVALIAVGTAFAAIGVSISRTETTLTVRRDGLQGELRGDVCIQLGRRGSNWRGEYWFNYVIPASGSQDVYRTFGDTIILSYSDVSCEVIDIKSN